MAEKDGVLRLQLLDVYANRLRGEKADIVLRHQTLNHSPVLRGLDASRIVVIRELYGPPEGLYRVLIDPPSYLPVSQFVNVKSGKGTELEIVFPVDPVKVTSISFPDYAAVMDDAKRLLENSDAVLGFEGKRGAELYSALDNIRRAGFLNIIAKCGRTRLSNNTTIISYLHKLYELRGDRFFVVVPHQLREETKNSVSEGIFEAVSGALHHPPPGYQEADSFKTLDHYGNLQLTFFTNGSDWRADVDIDDARGLEHVFQVIRNELTGRPTHPYDIHEVLVYYQDLDPGYRLNVRG